MLPHVTRAYVKIIIQVSSHIKSVYDSSFDTSHLVLNTVFLLAAKSQLYAVDKVHAHRFWFNKVDYIGI